MSQPRSALITGVTGFIGAALARRLTSEGVKVTGLVRPDSRREQLAGLPALELVELAEMGRPNLALVLHRIRPEVVFNLAAAGISEGDRDPARMFATNVEFAVNVVHAIADSHPATLIQTGSCAEYGAQSTDSPIDESAPLQPLSYYGSTKAAASLLLQSLARQLSVEVVVLRPFNVYGPGEGPQRLAPHVIRCLARGEPVALTSGTQVRDFLFIDDMIDALCTAACCREALVDEGPFNICSGQPASVRQIGEMLADLMAEPQSLLNWGARPNRTTEPHYIVGSGERFRAATGWSPQTSLVTGLQRTIDDCLATDLSRRKVA